jgi:serine phosphatase RsbU (regulator of sigma subunit)/methyl-accepting chemotaxis protein
MAVGRRRRGGLAARIVRVTLVVGAVTVFTAGAVALFGASRLAVQQVATRDQAALQLAHDQIVSRLSSVESIATQISELIASQRDLAAMDEEVSSIVDASSGAVESVIIADRSGKVITAFPSELETTTPIDTPAFQSALAGATGFRQVVERDRSWSLWLLRTLPTPSGRPVVLLLSLDAGFLQNALDNAAGGTSRVVAVMENGRLLLSSRSQDPPVLDRALWQATSSGAGEVSAESSGGRPMVGYYTDVRGIEGVEWRLVVLEPSTVTQADTVQAVAPTIFVLLIGAVVAVASALIVARRLVRPLRMLEATAYRAANGAFVRPIPSDTDDEIGQVADAFNAVALRLNALHDLSQLLASASQLEQVLDGILSAMRHIVGPGVAAIYLLDEDAEWLVPARARGAEVTAVPRVPASGDGWLAEALRETEVEVHSSGLALLKENIPGLATDQGVALTAPLVSGHEALGVIVVLRREHEPVSDAEREMVRTFSAQAAVALHNSRLFETETESLRVAEALRTVAERLVRPEGLSVALADVEEVVCDLFDAERAVFAIFNRHALGLPSAVNRGLETSLLSLSLRLFDDRGHRALAVQRGDDEEADDIMKTLGAAALLLAPVAVDSEHGAVLVISLVASNVSNRDLDLVEAVANEVALALDNAFLYERALSRAANLETVFRISQAVGSSLQVNVVLNRVLDVVQKILSADAVALMTYDSRKRCISTAMARGAIPAEVLSLETHPGEDVPGYVFSTGEPAAFRDLTETMGGVAGRAAAHNLRSLLAVPLLARGRSIGVLMVFSVDSNAFSDEDMNVLQTFASQAALALDTARLYSHEHDVASILQQSILPEALPEFPEIQAASAYQPVGSDAEIGGDYYDLFRAPDGALWFAIGDVCGKGVIAATKTSMIKYSVRAFVAAGFAPSAVLGEVNRFVAESGEASDIVTLWVGRLDAAAGVLTYSNGGHPPGILRHSDGTTERTEPTGPLLGALVGVAYGEETLQLGQGDLILLCTDGVTEARSEKEFFGEDRVEEAVAAGGSAEEIVRRLLTLVRRWVHGELRDDVAVLAIALESSASEHGTSREGEAD